MRIDDLAVSIAIKRSELEREIFAMPPQDYDEFVKRLGVWKGLGEALSMIGDAKKKEMADD